jgi:hypothetical protein
MMGPFALFEVFAFAKFWRFRGACKLIGVADRDSFLQDDDSGGTYDAAQGAEVSNASPGISSGRRPPCRK